MKSSMARPFPGRAIGSLCSLDFSLIVKKPRLIHVARFSSRRRPRPLHRAEDYSQWPVSSLTGADGQNFSSEQQKNPASSSGRGVVIFRSFLSHRYPRALYRLFGGLNLGGLPRPIRTEIRAHKLAID
jgi:hypothetical protein